MGQEKLPGLQVARAVAALAAVVFLAIVVFMVVAGSILGSVDLDMRNTQNFERTMGKNPSQFAR